MLKVLKKNCEIANFDKSKIENAILKAMKNNVVKPNIARAIADEIYEECKDKDTISIDEIEYLVKDKLITKKQRQTALDYEGYRAIKEWQNESRNYLDAEVLDMLGGNSEEYNDENSNKNVKRSNVRRDYMAGIVSKDICRKYIFSPDIIQAHDEGIIHIHDLDYTGQFGITNCCLINLEDMLQNGTVINDVMIEKPKSLLTAMTITTQIITSVASAQYGFC